jgi:hypothetical protein
MTDETLFADGLEKAFIGYFQRCGQAIVAVYDYEKCVKILMKRDGMTDEDAREFLDFNTVGAWMGEGTPAFLMRCSLKDFQNELDCDV